jgi:hypothetical protein
MLTFRHVTVTISDSFQLVMLCQKHAFWNALLVLQSQKRMQESHTKNLLTHVDTHTCTRVCLHVALLHAHTHARTYTTFAMYVAYTLQTSASM